MKFRESLNSHDNVCNELKIQLCAKDIALESNISLCENKRT